jgi:uncharacterized protein YlxW (UPF0749 family)
MGRIANLRHRLGGHHASAAVIALLTGLLGFAIVVQVHQNSSTDNLANLREDDLVGILDNQDARAERLRQQLADQEANLRQLQSSGTSSQAARKQAIDQQHTLGILLGTLPATGPGVTVTVTDPAHKLDGESLLDVIEELRGAGAEAIQVDNVRVSTSTSFSGNAGSVRVDNTPLTTPYRFVAIGDPKTLDTALNIPGGVASSIRTASGSLGVVEQRSVTIRVTRVLPHTKYVKPSH